MGVIWAVIVAGLNPALAQPVPGSAPAISIGFEEQEGYFFESAITRVEGWSASGEADGVIIGEAPFSGEQSLRVEANEGPVEVGYRTGGLPESGVRFIKAAIRPAPLERSGATARLDLWGSEIGFILSEDRTVKLSLRGDAAGEAESLRLATPVQVDGEGRGTHWLAVLIRQDLAAATWDLFLEGMPVAINLPMAEGADSLGIVVGPYEAIGLDGIGIGSENPLFIDSDGDGMPDAYEVAHRLNPHADDRNSDRDGDGIRNIDEYLAGSSPDVAGAGTVAQIIYVDNASGRDSNSGQFSHGVGAGGPKFSIKAAMAAAQSGAVIVVLPGTGTYHEGSRSAKGKRLTIRTVKPVIIK